MTAVRATQDASPLQPAVFAINGEGYAVFREGREQVSSQLQESVRRACSNCPERAILISDDQDP